MSRSNDPVPVETRLQLVLGVLAHEMETARFRDIYNRIRPHQALDDRTPRQAYLDT